MTIEYIRSIVAELKKRFGDISAEEMCASLGIKVLRISMGKKSRDCKGFFYMKSRIRVIVLNADLSRRNQLIILYHELGHAVLHKDMAIAKAFHDFELFDETDTCEYEANIFAAEYALPDDAVLEQLNDDTTFFAAAKTLRVPPELLDFKFRVLKRIGYTINPPYIAQSDFMKGIDRPNRYD